MAHKRPYKNRISLSPEPGQWESENDSQPTYYRPPPQPPQSTRLRPNQVGFKRDRTTDREGYSHIKYERELSRKIPKRLEWQVLSPVADAQLKQTLQAVYNKTIAHVAGSSANDMELYDQGKRYLQPIGKGIHQLARKKLFPGHVSDYLLKPDNRNNTVMISQAYSDVIYASAKLEFEVTRMTHHVETLTTQLRQAKEEHQRIKDEAATYNDLPDDPDDYVQMLFKYPSSQSY